MQCECLREEHSRQKSLQEQTLNRREPKKTGSHEFITFINKTYTQFANILYQQLLDSNLFIDVSQKHVIKGTQTDSGQFFPAYSLRASPAIICPGFS